MALVMEAEEELELSLGLSLGGSFMRKKSENPRTVTQMDLGFDGGVPTAEENGRKCGFFFGNGRPVVAERNKEAQQLRRRARDRAAKETEAFRLEGRRKDDGKCNDPRSGTMAPVQFPIHPVLYAPVRYGYPSPCAMPFWGPSSTQGAANSPGEGPVVDTSVGQTKAFRPFRRFNWRGPANAESEQSAGKGGSGGASPSDIQSAYLQGECGADSESHSSGSPLEEDANRNSISQSSAEMPEDPAPVTKPLLAAPAETPLSPLRRRTPSPVTNPESPNLSQERKSENREQGLPCEGMASLPKMPCVSTTGSGPNGKTITGFLYRYTKADQVSIVCVCHGSSFSPAEFVKHAGGTDVSHPLKHIVIVPSAF